MDEWLDRSRHPLHVLEYPASYGFQELDAQMTRVTERYRTMVRDRPNERIGLIVDISRVTRSEARNRARIAECIDELGELMKTRVVGHAYVVSNQVLRAAITAVSWLKPAPWPVKVFTDRGGAEAWIRRRLVSEGVAAHP